MSSIPALKLKDFVRLNTLFIALVSLIIVSISAIANPTFNDPAWGLYLTKLTSRIENSRIISKKTNQPGKASFTILTNGNIQNLRLLDSSGDESVDQEALKAIANMSPFQPLPASIHNNLDVKLSFEFGRVRMSYSVGDVNTN